MKRLLPLLIITTLLTFQNVSAQVSCQDITVQLDGSGSYSFTTPLTPQVDASVASADGSTTFIGDGWQSFTPTVDGILNSVTVTFGTAPTAGTLTFSVFDGQGTGGTNLYTSPLISGSYPSGTPFTFDIHTVINLVAGNEYTFVFSSASAPWALQKNGADPYAGGISSYGAGVDLRFSLDILQRPEIDNGSTDADGIDFWQVDVSSFNCSNVGLNTVTLTMWDKVGNSTTCASTVTVEDNEDPVVACIAPWVAGGSNSFLNTPSAAIPDNTPSGVTSTINVTDNSIISDANVNIDITHTWVGDLEVILQSPNGTMVTLVDRPGYTGIGFGCSENDISATLDDEASTAIEDECAVAVPAINGSFIPNNPLSAFDGENALGIWTITVIDNAGGDTGTLIDWGLDLEYAPSGLQLALDVSGNVTVDPNAIDNGTTDNCSFTLSVSPTNFNCGNIGVQNVTLTATDPSSNSTSCVTSVSVADLTPPTALCQDKTLVLDGSGSATLLTSDINNGSSDNCAISTMSLDQTSFNCSDLGTNTVTLTVNDVNGLSSTCTATVTVEDNQTPSITCPGNITICSVDGSGSIVTYPAVTGSDNCVFTITQTDGSGLTSGSTFPIGTTTQEWTVADIATNTNSCTFDITVNATPVADYSYTAACQGEAIFFSDESTIASGYSIVSWSWDMGDGSGPITLVDPIFSYADTGMYDVALTVVSGEGCSSTFTQTVHVTPVPSASFTYVGDCEGNPIAFTNTSTIDAGNLNYSWNFGDSGTSTDESPTHTYAIDGTYTVTLTVTSDDGCSDVTTASVEVQDSPTALFTASTVCEGNETVFTNLSTGGGTLTYSWDFGDSNSSTDANPTHTYAVAGTYTVVLTTTNTNGCTDTHTATVTVNALPTVDFTFSNVCEGTSASFVNASSPGTSNWDLGDNSSSTLTNVNHVYTTFGTYDVTLTVTSSQGCVNSNTQQIEIYDLPDFFLTPSDVLCYGESTGSIVVTAQGTPASPWTLSLNNGTPQASVNFNGIPAGAYDITAIDANGCEFTVSTTVDQPSDTLGIGINGLVDILCNGASTGEINVHGTGGTSPYMYAVDAGTPQSTGNFSGLEAGSHLVQILDANSCLFDTTIVLTEPDTLVLGLVNAEDLLCNGDNSGSIEVMGTGGVAPYQYNLDGSVYGSPNTFSGLAAGMYVVGVMDANGCSDTLHVTLTEPGILMLSLLSSEDAVCNGESNGTITVGAASGTPPYQYSLDGVNYQGSGVFDGLSAGTYTVTVRDANGCLDQVTETIFEPSLLTIETNSTPVGCFGDATGEIEIIAAGGTPTYDYSINAGASFQANGGIFTGLNNGTFLAVVRDANGCTASEGVIVSQPSSPFVLSANVTNALCLNTATGVVTLVGNGGTPTYTYSDDNISFGSGNVFNGFAAGTYTLYAQDLNGCTDDITVNIGQPATAVNITGTITNNPACPNSATGTATVQVSGGTPGYTYSSNGGNTFQTSSTLTGLNGGNHLIVAMDANGCTDTDTITLTSPPIFDIVVDTIVSVPCEGDFSGEIHVTAQGGTPSYNYFLNGANLQTNGDYVNQTNGTYTIMIMDVNGCSYSEPFEITADVLQPVASFSYLVTSTAILFTNSSQNGDSYSWDFGDGSTSTDESPVHVYAEDGVYNVTLTVTNSCGTETYTANINTTATGIADGDDVISFGIYPNPANSELFVQPSTEVRSNLNLEVISMSGQVLNSLSVSGLSATGRLAIDVSELATGLYYLRIIGDDQQTVLRFDVIK